MAENQTSIDEAVGVGTSAASHLKSNPHYQERIRATIYEHKDQYIPVARGWFRLNYEVA